MVGGVKKPSDRWAETAKKVAFLNLSLTFNRKASKRSSLKAGLGNRLVTHLADAVGPLAQTFKRLVDLLQSILLLREKIEGKFTIVGITPRIGLMQAVGRGFVGIITGAKIFPCHSRHGIEQGIF